MKREIFISFGNFETSLKMLLLFVNASNAWVSTSVPVGLFIFCVFMSFLHVISLLSGSWFWFVDTFLEVHEIVKVQHLSPDAAKNWKLNIDKWEIAKESIERSMISSVMHLCTAHMRATVQTINHKVCGKLFFQQFFSSLIFIPHWSQFKHVIYESNNESSIEWVVFFVPTFFFVFGSTMV